MTILLILLFYLSGMFGTTYIIARYTSLSVDYEDDDLPGVIIGLIAWPFAILFIMVAHQWRVGQAHRQKDKEKK